MERREEPQEKTVLQQQIAQWLEEHQGEIAVVAADEQMALDLQQSAVEAGRQHEISIFSLEYSREIERAIRAALIYGALLENPIQMGENTVRKFLAGSNYGTGESYYLPGKSGFTGNKDAAHIFGIKKPTYC